MNCPKCGERSEDEDPIEIEIEGPSGYFRCQNDDCVVDGFTVHLDSEDLWEWAIREVLK